jgi:hypothetical protein
MDLPRRLPCRRAGVDRSRDVRRPHRGTGTVGATTCCQGSIYGSLPLGCPGRPPRLDRLQRLPCRGSGGRGPRGWGPEAVLERRRHQKDSGGGPPARELFLNSAANFRQNPNPGSFARHAKFSIFPPPPLLLRVAFFRGRSLLAAGTSKLKNVQSTLIDTVPYRQPPFAGAFAPLAAPLLARGLPRNFTSNSGPGWGHHDGAPRWTRVGSTSGPGFGRRAAFSHAGGSVWGGPRRGGGGWGWRSRQVRIVQS